ARLHAAEDVELTLQEGHLLPCPLERPLQPLGEPAARPQLHRVASAHVHHADRVPEGLPGASDITPVWIVVTGALLGSGQTVGAG
ncbi:MAG: hypothetical protein JWN77_2965, partial [Frankiales bacterium]|nr:hypothetical protein [Frankiales bacterium]